MQSNETRNQIGYMFKGLFPVLLVAGAMVTITILMVTDALSFETYRRVDLGHQQIELAPPDNQAD